MSLVDLFDWQLSIQELTEEDDDVLWSTSEKKLSAMPFSSIHLPDNVPRSALSFFWSFAALLTSLSFESFGPGVLDRSFLLDPPLHMWPKCLVIVTLGTDFLEGWTIISSVLKVR